MSITPSSGNVFADIGHPHPEEALAKAQLIFRITTFIENHNLSLEEAASRLGILPSELSLLLDGQLGEFTIDCLTRYLEVLNEDAKMTVHST
jgi:predicted XRE-type DNA-binding protein